MARRRRTQPNEEGLQAATVASVTTEDLRAALAEAERRAVAAEERARAAERRLEEDRGAIIALERLAREDAEVAAARLRAVLEVLPVGVSIVDGAGRPTLVNDETRRIWGQQLPLAEGTAQYSAYTAWWPRTGERVRAQEWGLARALANGEVATNEEIDIETFAGERKTILASSAPVRDESGAIVGAVAVVVDMTERRRLERRTSEALDALLLMARVLVEPDVSQPPEDGGAAPGTGNTTREIAQRLALLTADVLGCQRVGIQIVEPETRLIRPVAVVGLAPQQERQWWAEQEALTVRYGEGGDPALLARFEAGEALVIDMTTPPYNQLPNPYGITTSLTAPMRIGGAVVGLLSLDYGGPRHEFVAYEIALAEAVAQLAALVIERDRLLRQRAEAQARELALLAINEHMDDFLSMAAHDLKSPVAGAKLIAQTAERRVQRLVAAVGAATPQVKQQSTELERALGSVSDQMDRLAHLVDRLLDVSRARTGKLEVVLEPCDLAVVVRACAEQQRALAPTRTISVTLPGDGEVLVQADAMRIEQVVTNYLTNAVRYSDAGRPIAVSLRVEGAQARVAVRDEGLGIAPDAREYIWSRFERARGVQQQTGTDTGLGLGLYISRSIIERHGGAVGVESELGKGSTFWFTLPLDNPTHG